MSKDVRNVIAVFLGQPCLFFYLLLSVSPPLPSLSVSVFQSLSFSLPSPPPSSLSLILVFIDCPDTLLITKRRSACQDHYYSAAQLHRPILGFLTEPAGQRRSLDPLSTSISDVDPISGLNSDPCRAISTRFLLGVYVIQILSQLISYL